MRSTTLHSLTFLVIVLYNYQFVLLPIAQAFVGSIHLTTNNPWDLSAICSVTTMQPLDRRSGSRRPVKPLKSMYAYLVHYMIHACPTKGDISEYSYFNNERYIININKGIHQRHKKALYIFCHHLSVLTFV